MNEAIATGPVIHQVQADMLGKMATQAIHMKQLDNRLRYLEVQLVSGDETVSYPVPDGARVRLRGLKPDGTGAYIDAVQVAGDTATFEITSNFLAASGKMPCEVEITLGESVVKSRTFTVDIDKEALPSGAVISTDEYTALLAAADAAKLSEKAAALSETNAANSAGTASTKAAEAASSASSAAGSASAAAGSAVAAKDSEDNAAASRDAAAESER